MINSTEMIPIEKRANKKCPYEPVPRTYKEGKREGFLEGYKKGASEQLETDFEVAKHVICAMCTNPLGRTAKKCDNCFWMETMRKYMLDPSVMPKN